MDIRVIHGDIIQQSVGAIVVNLFEGVTVPAGATAAVDDALGGAVSKLIEEGEIRGKRGEMTLIHTLGKMLSSRVLVAGLGKSSGLTLDAVRSVAGESCRYLRRVGVETVATIVHGAGIGGIETHLAGQAIAEGSLMGLYRFDKHKSDGEDRREIKELTVVEFDGKKAKLLEKGVAEGTVVGEAVNLCRDMVNEPPNFMTPTRMAEMALDVAREADLEIQVLDRSDMSELGMGALLGVAQGSDEPPKLIVLRYRGDQSEEANDLGLVGKGITFDSGGLDIKTASGMATMKGDMAGGAAVISTMKAIGQLRPKANVTAVVAATENMPGGRAQRPGDVVRTMNGKTIEIGNTDAEGRLVLADAVAYARSLGVSHIVDVATLTGAIVVALGKLCTGAFGNDQEFTDRVITASNHVGERVWQLPTYEEYRELYRSEIADIRNVGGRGAGSIIGAQIIGEFSEGTPWVHLDIAGTSSTASSKGYNPKGATGTPVRTLIELTRRQQT